MNAAVRHAPVDTRTAWKIVISVVAVVGAVGGLLFASGMEGAEHYRFVDEVMKDPAALQSKRVRVHGHVVEGSIMQEKGTLNYQFRSESRAPRETASIKVYYRGVVPDTFKSGAEVVATGILDANNELRADRIEAKCPSKYEGKEGGPGVIPEMRKGAGTPTGTKTSSLAY